MEELYGKNED